MTARVFALPRLASGPASGAFAACLQERGFDLVHAKLLCTPKGHHELVREISSGLEGAVYERMDGVRVTRRLGQIATEPERA